MAEQNPTVRPQDGREHGFPLDKYTRGRNLGSGGVGSVYEYTWTEAPRENEKSVAVKTFNRTSEKALRIHGIEPGSERGHNLLLDLEHDHLVKIFDINRKPSGKPYVVFEKCDGSLKDLLEARGNLSFKDAACVLRQILSGLMFLHQQKGIIHRDIKPGNILLKTKEKDPDWETVSVGDITVKIGDYDFVRGFVEVDGEQTVPLMTAHPSTPKYLAPEIKEAFFRNQTMCQYTYTADMFSVGVLALELIRGRGLPVPSLSELQQDERLRNERILLDFLLSMLEENRHRRKSAEELLVHPFLDYDFEGEGRLGMPDHARQVGEELTEDDLESVRFPLNLYEKGPEIGRGAYGIVRRWNWRNAEVVYHLPQAIAVKKMPYFESSLVAREIGLHSQLRHQNVVKYYGSCSLRHVKISIAMELCQGNLKRLLMRRQLREDEASLVLKQILLGLDHLHQRHIIHRDIKPRNVLLKTDQEHPEWSSIPIKEIQFKLADFGLSRRAPDGDSQTMTVVGALNYMAPEIMDGLFVNKRSTRYSYSADIFSIGITGGDILGLGRTVNENGHQLLEDDMEGLSEAARSFLTSSTKLVPRQRPTAKELLRHEFIRNPSQLPRTSIRRQLTQEENQNALLEQFKQMSINFADPRHFEKVNQDLMTAIQEENYEAVEFSLKLGPNVNQIVEGGRNMLHLAAENNDADIVTLLIRRGAEHGVCKGDERGNTPLHVAAERGNLQVVRVLVEEGRGADLNAVNGEGLTPEQLAQRRNKDEVVQYLVSRT